MTQYLILLAIIPLGCFQLTKMFNTKDKWLFRGISVGMIIAPLSYGMLQFAYVPVIGKIVAFFGLILNLTHGPVGYFALAGSGIIQPGIELAAPQLMLIHLVNGVIFACCYGMIGFSIDRKLEAERAAGARAVIN